MGVLPAERFPVSRIRLLDFPEVTISFGSGPIRHLNVKLVTRIEILLNEFECHLRVALG